MDLSTNQVISINPRHVCQTGNLDVFQKVFLEHLRQNSDEEWSAWASTSVNGPIQQCENDCGPLIFLYTYTYFHILTQLPAAEEQSMPFLLQHWYFPVIVKSETIRILRKFIAVIVNKFKSSCTHDSDSDDNNRDDYIQMFEY